jgi:hypothetical protein
MYKISYYLFLALFLPNSLFAWGKVGHQSTAIIAEKNLSPKAIKEITALVGSTDLRESSLWPDKIKSEAAWFHSKPFHFTSVEDGQAYYDSLKNLRPDEVAEGDAIRALLKSEDVLRSAKASKSEKVMALKFLVHLVSDIHQPLHTGRPIDYGGNSIKLDWFGKSASLHSVWDYGILDAFLQTMTSPDLLEDAPTYVKLMQVPSTKKTLTWTKGNYLEWHNESQALRLAAYDLVDLENSAAVAKFRTVVDERIHKSGLRLAFILNNIFGNVAINKEGLALRTKLNTILGTDHLNQISLMPLTRNKFQERAAWFSAEFHHKYDCPHDH